MLRISLKPCLFLLLACLLAGCSARSDLPAGVDLAIQVGTRNYYTRGLSGSPAFDKVTKVKIARDWRAKDAPGTEAANEDADLWCAEVTVTGERSGVSTALTAAWIVERPGPQAMWQAAALETISAEVTIERCDRDQ